FVQVQGGATMMAPKVFVSSSVMGPENGVLLVLAMGTTKLPSKVAASCFVHGSPILVIFRLVPVLAGGGTGLQRALGTRTVAVAVLSAAEPPAGVTILTVLLWLQ